MRFSTLAVFMLPLSALAAPSLLKRQAPARGDTTLATERAILSSALNATRDALEYVKSAISLPQQVAPPALVTDTSTAILLIKSAIAADQEGDAINRDGDNFSDASNKLAELMLNVLDCYSTILGLKEQTKDSGNATLVEYINTANQQISNATSTGLNIIRLRGQGSNSNFSQLLSSLFNTTRGG